MQAFQHPDNNQTSIVLSKKEAKALLEFASDDGTREFLHGVCFRMSPDGTRRVEAIATDGHTLLVLRSPDAVPASWTSPVPIGDRPYVIVPKPALARAVKACGARESIAVTLGPVRDAVTLACVPHAGRKGEGEPLLGSPSSTLTTADPAVPFPDVDKVIPPAREHDHGSTEGAAHGSAIFVLSPQYLARIAIVSDAIDEARVPTVRVSVPPATYRERSRYHDADEPTWDMLDPVRFDLEGTAASAVALIMPIRIGIKGGAR